jgi:ribokinase
MFIILNPSPMNENILGCDLRKISMFIMNDTEGYQITEKKDPEDILDTMLQRYPSAQVVLTLGKHGCLYRDSSVSLYQDALPVKAADTTGAGDTFTGYFIASMIDAMPVSDGLMLATKAASMAVMKKGAASSIPYRKDVESAVL